MNTDITTLVAQLQDARNMRDLLAGDLNAALLQIEQMKIEIQDLKRQRAVEFQEPTEISTREFLDRM